MSSNIPTRRVTRTSRVTTLKENENANVRVSRLATRTKPIGTAITSNATTTTNAPRLTRATAGTVASRARTILGDSKLDPPVGKRKRDVLAESSTITAKENAARRAGLKDDGKKEKFDGVVLKSKATTVIRQPLRTVSAASRQTAIAQVVATTVSKPTGLEKAKEQPGVAKVDDPNAMVVDPPVQLPSIAVRRSIIAKENNAAAVRRSDAYRRASARSIAVAQQQARQDDEADRVFKKRRTSSDTPEEDTGALEEARLRAEEEEAATKLVAEMEAFAEEPEADPETGPWDDLDADDIDDPLMVSEYVVDIFKYLKQLELTTMPNPHYMESQKELAWKMRGILTDWLIQVHVRFRLLPETLFLCVNTIDRFLSARVVSLAKLQLVGVACMFIAAKFEEVVAPSVTHFLLCADSTYTESEILQAERYILKTLDWNLSYPNPVHYLRRISKADDYNVHVRTLGKYLLEIGCLEWRLIAAPPSLLAGAAIWLSRLVLGYEVWSPNLAHYSSYPESALVPTANLMLNYILKPIRHESFHKKYAGKRFSKSSIVMREWALARWSEGTQVDLSKELPEIKTQIRLARQAEELRQQESSEDLVTAQLAPHLGRRERRAC